MRQSRWSESAEKHVCNEQTSSSMSMNFHLKRFHISRETTEIVLHVIKQCLRAFYHHRNWFSKKLMCVGVQVCRGIKSRIFLIDPQKTKVNQKTYIDFWRRPCCQNAAVCIQTMISSSCKTALHHTAPKQLKIFFETTRPISLAHKSGHRIRQIWICKITQLGISCKNLSTKEGVNHLRISKIFRMLSETNGTMSMTRQSSYIAVKKAFSSCGKAEWRTYSAYFPLISWLIRITVTFWCSLLTTNSINYELLANIVLFRLYHG